MGSATGRGQSPGHLTRRAEGVDRRRFLARMLAAGGGLACLEAAPRLAAQSRFLRPAMLADGVMDQRPAERGAFAPSFAEREPALAFLYREIQRSTLDRTPGGGSRAVSGPRARPTDIGPIIEHEIPTLFVVGEEDSIFPPAALEAMHRKLPGSEFALVPGAGHSVYFERPDVFNRLVIEFLKRHTSPGGG